MVVPKPRRRDRDGEPLPAAPDGAALLLGLGVKPASVHTPGPLGRPVGDALDVQAAGAVGRDVREAVKAIGKVHGVGILPTIPVMENDSDKENGSYTRTALNQPKWITISSKGKTRKLTTAHEIGHFVEKAGVPGAVTAAGDRDWATDPFFRDWYDAVQKTEAVERIRRTAAAGSVDVHANGEVKSVKIDQDYTNYLLKPSELWARSYAQYIARKSEDGDMLDSLAESLTSSESARQKTPTQWYSKDFEPVERAIDALLSRMGWRK